VFDFIVSEHYVDDGIAVARKLFGVSIGFE
jgi:hypothetical protein